MGPCHGIFCRSGGRQQLPLCLCGGSRKAVAVSRVCAVVQCGRLGGGCPLVPGGSRPCHGRYSGPRDC